MQAIIQTQSRLVELEEVIRYGLQTFVDVGNALKEINEGRLYREQGYKTFEDYCEKRWNMAARTAYHKIKAAEVAENVSSGTHSISFTQARELTALTTEQQIEVSKNTDFSATTVAEVREIVAQVKESSETKEAAPVKVEKSKFQELRDNAAAMRLERTIGNLGGLRMYLEQDGESDVAKALTVWSTKERKEWAADALSTASVVRKIANQILEGKNGKSNRE
jgi:hypothetical protein